MKVAMIINDKSEHITCSGIMLRDLFNPVSRHVSMLMMQYHQVRRAELRNRRRHILNEKTMLELTSDEHPTLVKIIIEDTVL